MRMSIFLAYSSAPISPRNLYLVFIITALASDTGLRMLRIRATDDRNRCNVEGIVRIYTIVWCGQQIHYQGKGEQDRYIEPGGNALDLIAELKAKDRPEHHNCTSCFIPCF
jgi:hypothetical protein